MDGYLCEAAKEVVAVQRIVGDNVTDKTSTVFVFRKELNFQWQVLNWSGSSQEGNSLVKPSVGRRVHLVQLVEDRVRALVSEVVDDVLHARTL
jgi:hypothetical protein